ncbi:MAG: hypothetical protein N2036_14920 [Bryobacteraceae bacterium]|nr:hypothetical protein [Bryobacteraceae bacterium]MCX7605366.1 hypothetical protein [Bryobacteraceae bacterium]
MGEPSVYLHDEPDALRFEVRGRLDRRAAAEILASAATAASMRNGRPLVIDLRRVEAMDEEAPAMLAAASAPEPVFLLGDAQIEPVAAAVARRPQLVRESPLPRLRRWWCALLGRLRPGCCCRMCLTQRVWSL